MKFHRYQRINSHGENHELIAASYQEVYDYMIADLRQFFRDHNNWLDSFLDNPQELIETARFAAAFKGLTHEFLFIQFKTIEL